MRILTVKQTKTWTSTCIAALILNLGLMSCSSDTRDEVNIVNVKASNLLAEGMETPLNVHNSEPRLSWHANVITQSAYQIQVASSQSNLLAGNADLWDSGKVVSRQSLNIPYQGKKLESTDTAFWRVRVWSKEDTDTLQQWSDAARWEMGLTKPQDWKAKWIQVEKQTVSDVSEPVKNWMLYAANIHKNANDSLAKSKQETQERVYQQLTEQPTASLFRNNFVIPIDKTIVKARLHSTAAGYYEIFVNGKKVDDRIADPGQTDFDERILYNTDDVLSLLTNKDNVIAVHLGSGWYDENIAFSKWNNPDAAPSNSSTRSLSYGQPKFIAQLEITYADGSKQIVASDQNWLSHASPVLKEGLFSGEMFDANLAITNWKSISLPNNLEHWKPVQVLSEWPTKRLIPQLFPPIRAVLEMKADKLYQPKEKVWVLDFGQNFTGIPTLHLDKLNLRPGQSINLRYAEWADVDGNISQKTGGGAPLLKQVDTYVASNVSNQNQADTWSPAFTWHGFRYIEITGLDSPPSLDSVSAHLVRSDVEIVGTFNSGNKLINRVHDMALWSYESNLMAVPMDCPIRERAGWTGDAHAALITGNYNVSDQYRPSSPDLATP